MEEQNLCPERNHLTEPKSDKNDSNETNTTIQFPYLQTRVKALMIDSLVITCVCLVTSFLITTIGDPPTWIKGSIFVFMFILYDPLLTSFTGGTLGHKIMGIQVKDYYSPEENISFFNAVIRFVIKGLLGWISFITVTGNKSKRSIHDMAGRSIVLYKEEA